MQIELTPEQHDFVRRAVDEGRLTKESMRELAEDVNRRGRERLLSNKSV